MKYHLVQLGCQMNQADGERIAAVLQAMGYTPTDNEEDASILGIVACSVRQKAIDKVFSKVEKWNSWKAYRNILTFASGCVLPADQDRILERFDLLFPISKLTEFPEMIRQYGVPTPLALATSPGALDRELNLRTLTPRQEIKMSIRKTSTLNAVKQIQTDMDEQGGTNRIMEKVTLRKGNEDPLGGFWNIQPTHQSPYEAFVPIQNGCNKFCSFCAVPYTRGREVSRPANEILEEIQSLVDRGYHSITLLGQNVNSWGQDLGEFGFADLLKAIGTIGDKARDEKGLHFWVYFTAPHPRDMDVAVFEAIAAHECLAKQIHLPLQSGDDHILMRMNRKHGLDLYRKLVVEIRRIIPEATLFTDLIVGFSGETDEHSNNTAEAMREFAFNMAYIALYSPRPGATSSRWDDDVPLDTKKQRFHDLSDVLRETSYAWNQKQLGHTVTAIVEGHERKAGYLSARNEGKIQIRFPIPSDIDANTLIGQFVQLRVDSIQPLCMEGSFQGIGYQSAK